MDNILTIRQLAKQTGVPSKTLRYWESVGILLPPTRNYKGYRIYRRDILGRVAFIQKAKRLGFTLAEIRELFSVSKQQGPACETVVKWTERKILVIERQIEVLAQLRDQLRKHHRVWSTKLPCPPKSLSEICCLIEQLPLVPIEKVGEIDAIPTRFPTRYRNHDARQSLALPRKHG